MRSEVVKLSWHQAAAWRVMRHHLERRASAGSLLEVASRLCGLHAQLMSSAELSAWARLEDLDRTAVSRALWEERTLVKTWAMRGTLHLLPAKELPLWHAGLRKSGRYLREAAWQNYFGISLQELDQVTQAVGKALAGQVLTREELMREVGRLTGSASLGKKVLESSWGTILKPAAFAGHLCFAPSLGQCVRFTRPDTWASAGIAIEQEAAYPEITRRFLAAYGPATAKDLGRWWGGGSGVTNARKWIGELGDEVCAVDLEGVKAWMPSAHVEEAGKLPPSRSVRLLPGFDPYVVEASPHAEHLLPGDFRKRVYRPQGWISPVLLAGGRMLGTWRHAMKGSRIEVTVEPFVGVPLWVKRAACKEAERLAAFLGLALKLTWA